MLHVIFWRGDLLIERIPNYPLQPHFHPHFGPNYGYTVIKAKKNLNIKGIPMAALWHKPLLSGIKEHRFHWCQKRYRVLLVWLLTSVSWYFLLSVPPVIGPSTESAIAVPKHQPVTYGGGLLTTHSSCRIARWLYLNEEGTNECYGERALEPERQLNNASQLEDNDTIFVPFSAINRFLENIMGEIRCNVCIISGMTQHTPPVSNAYIGLLLSSPQLIRWFAQNLPIYGGEDPRHPKVSPWPYGLKETGNKGRLTLNAYKQVLFSNSSVGKDVTVYAGPMGNTVSSREKIPRDRSLHPHEYFTRVAKSRYLLSPNGDRPECYRHVSATEGQLHIS